MEIVALVAMYSLTNFFNNVFDPENDFPPSSGPVRSEFYQVATIFFEDVWRRRLMQSKRQSPDAPSKDSREHVWAFRMYREG
jgi:hypothetical protein